MNVTTSVSNVNLLSEPAMPSKPLDQAIGVGAVDIRGGFVTKALNMGADELKTLLMRHDLVCNSETDVLTIVLTYIKTKVQEHYDAIRKTLLPCVKFDQLDSDTLIKLSMD